jgi:hypothetical protein
MAFDYQTPIPPIASKHDHAYTAILGAIGLLLVMGMISLSGIRHRPEIDANAKAVFLSVIAMEGCMLAAIVGGLVIRLAFPAYRRWPTFGLNFILLLFFPFGTALAIYGFWKVDKNLREVSN